MVRTISILGSTGSIGTQTLEVAASCGIRVAALAANRSIDLLERQARQFHPIFVAAADPTAAANLAQRLSDTDITVLSGEEGVRTAAELPQADTVVNALVGVAGLRPTLAAIDAGKRILLTASGGPFYGWSREKLETVTPERALQHPNWDMGAKVTIDSATLMNKGLELLEAMALFGLPPEKIEILIHRESILHSAVEYCDNSVVGQMGAPDMRLPIQYALTWPARTPGPAKPLDLFSAGQLTFAKPDLEAFPCLALAIQAAKEGGVAPTILNAANEVAVSRFLAGKAGFMDIPKIVEDALKHVPRQQLTLSALYRADELARKRAAAWPERP